MEKLKRQEIAPGIILEKYQTEEKKKRYYIFKLEVQIFNTIDFTTNFQGSENVELQNTDTLISNVQVEPFTKKTVAKLVLKANWTLKTKFKFVKNLPEPIIQKKYLAKICEKIYGQIDQMKEKWEGKDLLNTPQEQILNKMKQQNIKFVDLDFQPNIFSVGLDYGEDIDRWGCYIHWRCLKYIYLKMNEVDHLENLPYIYENGVEVGDIKPGELNNNWFISAVAMLAEQPALIKRLILTKKANSVGIYRMKLCLMGDWVTLVLDDFFPCYPLGDPIFNQNHTREFWLLLVEKAYAKAKGNYMSLMNGDIKEALMDLTGCPSFKFDLNDNEVDLWDDIRKWHNYGYLLSISTGAFDIEGSKIGNTAEQSYCILRTEEFEDTCLLKLRNIWGIFNWDGDWSKDSDLWTDELKKELKPNFEEEKTFWISYEHALENFEKLHVCHLRNWEELRLKGKFVQTVHSDNPDIHHLCSRWYYQMKIVKKTKVILGLHQEDERNLGVKETRPYLDIGIAILKYENEQYNLYKLIDTQYEREILKEQWFEPGEYMIVPLSVGLCLKFENKHKKIFNEYDVQDKIILSVIRDIFQKFDIICDRYLNFNEVKAFYKFFDQDLTKEKYQTLRDKYSVEKAVDEVSEGISQKGFVVLFSDLLKTKNHKEQLDFFEKLGYDKDLFSHTMRLFTLTLHTNNNVKVVSKDALEENMDFITYKLIIKNKGKIITEENEEKVKLYCYHNKKIDSYSYGIFNPTDKVIRTNLNFENSKNIICSYDNPEVSKIIDKNSFQFILHSQAIPDCEEHRSLPDMTWE